MITVKVEGKEKQFNNNVSYYEICKSFGYDNKILGAKVNNEIFALDEKINNNADIKFFDVTDLNGHKMYKSALMFIFEVALRETYPELEITYQHSVPQGFLGEIIGNKIISREDLIKIRNNMAKIISEDIPFKKLNVKKKEAIKYYESVGEYEKADNIQNISDKIITFYELKEHLNFFYTFMPYSTGCITNYDIVYLGNNRLVFVLPNQYTKELVPEYTHHDNIINSFLEGEHWLETQHMTYVTEINKTVGTGQIKEFIKSSELVFKMYISRIVNNVINNKDIKFVLIAGPSSSGKTTTTKVFSSFLRAHGFDPIPISTDDFFCEREETPRDADGNYDFECLGAIDLELFNNTLNKLLNGEEVELPSYNFTSGKKEYKGNYVKLTDKSIILIEGLHTLNDELLPMIENKLKYKIYLSPFLSLNIDKHNYVSTIDLRLIRRIVRDNRTRGYDVNKTIDAWQSVRNGEEKYIFPYIHQANTIINTSFPFELGVLKVYVEPLLYSVSVNSKYYEEARRLLNFLKIFYTIPSEYVGKDSVLREFIGGLDD